MGSYTNGLMNRRVGIKRSPDRGVARRVTGAQRDYRFSMVDDWSI